MTVLFTIELRVPYGDNGKYEIAKRAVQQVAVQAYARAMTLMDDGDMPEIVIHSHDYEYGHRDVPFSLVPENDAEMAAMSMRFAERAAAATPTTRRLFLSVIPSFLGRAIARDVQI